MARQEEWRDIAWTNGLYRVSSWGRVWSTRRGKALRPRESRGGYRRVTFCLRGVVRTAGVARLVCEAFHGPCPFVGAETAHLDGNPKHDVPENLAWVTHKENQAHQVNHGTAVRGDRHPRAKLRAADIPVIRQAIASGETKQSIAAQYGVLPTTIHNVASGVCWAWVPQGPSL